MNAVLQKQFVPRGIHDLAKIQQRPVAFRSKIPDYLTLGVHDPIQIHLRRREGLCMLFIDDRRKDYDNYLTIFRQFLLTFKLDSDRL